MIQQTSLLAFEQLKEDLGRRQLQILKGFAWFLGGATDLEVADRLKFADPNRVRPRRKELKDKGLIFDYEVRACCISGRKAIAWRLTRKGLDLLARTA